MRLRETPANSWAARPVAVIVALLLLSLPALAQPLKQHMQEASVGQDAYTLRMQGQTDEAKAILEDALSTDPDNAIALYELSRTQLYLMDFNGMQNSIVHAVRLDPENAQYHFFAGRASIYAMIDAAHKQNKDAMRGYSLKAIQELF
jgi:cytochrome c-type biogenesis protein CcmH/NrfG